MKTQPTNIPTTSGLWLVVLALLLACHAGRAQTFVSGIVSGTWSPSGNPYIVTDSITVPGGQTLTIQPGVKVLIGQDLSVTVNGFIQAVGTPSQRITFQAPINSQYWSNIILGFYQTGTNRFKYCDFGNANTALYLYLAYPSTINTTEIMNCTFSNCTSQAIYGECWSDVTQIPVIKNCVFNSTSNGCVLKIINYFGSGYATPRITANLFLNLSGTAFRMDQAGGGSSPALFINNTILNSRFGVHAQDPWDARVQNNIFVGVTNAVTASGSLTRNVGYNCFYGNGTNFTGYPGTYGSPIFANRNGTASDILYNIFQDPLFFGVGDFHLQANSTCIDAGSPDWAFTDMCFPPSLGNSYPDQGAYGGPDACNWLDVVPVLPVTLTVSQTNGIGALSWDALPRSTYRIQYVTNLVSAGTNIWLNLTDILAADKPTSIVGPVDQPKVFYRIQSLGRTPGN